MQHTAANRPGSRVPLARIGLGGQATACVLAGAIGATCAASPSDTGVVVVVTASHLSWPEPGTAAAGYRFTNALVGALGRLPLNDTPYSLHVTSGDLIEHRIVHSPTEALKTDPTVAPLMSESGYSSMHRVMVRGFTAADQSELRDGLTDRSFTIQPVENVERIEVLNGYSGFLYGFSALGGTVNYVSKKPTSYRLTDLTVGEYDNGVFFGHLDLGGPLPGDLGYRVNVYDEDGSTWMDNQNRQRDMFSVALDWRPNENTVLNLAFYHQDLEETGIATYFDNSGISYRVPTAFDPTKQYGQPWTYNKSRKDVVALSLDTPLNDVFTLRAGALYGDMWREYRYIKANFTDINGAYTESLVDSPRNEESAWSACALLDARFDTWGAAHTLTFGYTDWGFTFRRGADRTMLLGPSTIQDPAAYAIPGAAGQIDRETPTVTHNFLVGDRIALGPDWSVLAGLNYTLTRTTYRGGYLTTAPPLPPDYSGPTSLRQKTSSHDLTPAFGVVYKVLPDASLYASYMEGVQPGGTAPATAANAGAILAATANRQYETGVKATIGSAFDLSCAFFRMEQVNSYVDPADNVYKADGRDIHQGVEVVGTGRLLHGLNVVGGFTLMSAQIEKATTPASEGATPVNVPQQLASLRLEYTLPPLKPLPGTVTLCAGGNYLGERPVNVPNTQNIPGVTLFDAGLRYQPMERLTLNLHVSNLADTRYWEYYRSGDGLLLGAPRTVAVSAEYFF
jgi:iron complex outermembrane receptor protein